jgi:sugar lactone lactonase YvrE
MAIKIQNSTIIDDSRNIVNAGVTTVTSVSIGNTQVISSARQLQNIASLDATTTATIESAIANAPNTFTDLNVTGISTFTNGPVLVGSGTSTGTASQRLQVTGGAYVSGSVGIGTTNPQDTLDVGLGTIRLYNKSIPSRYSQIYQDNALTFKNSSGGDDFDFYQGTSLLMRLFGGGELVVGSNSRTGTASQRLQVTGGAYVSGNVGIGTTNPTSKLSVDGDGNFTGVVTASSFSGNASSATYATSSGISTFATTAGIATFADNAGISTNLKGGLVGNIPYQSAADTTVFLANGSSGTILQSNGVGNAPSWITAAPADAITGLTVRDEGTIVGGANSVSQFDFVGSNISVASTAGIATITIADNLVGTALSVSGITTTGTLNVGTGGTIITTTTAGSVGIKTTNPQSTLDVRGTISIGRTDASTVNSIRSVTDINSWEYAGVFDSVSAQDTAPTDIYFKDDGTKMFILGDTGNDVNEYSLSTAWEVNTATFTTNFSFASQETQPLGLYFKPDGTRMYICGTTAVSPANADQVRSYTLSNPWDISTGVTYDSKAYTTSDTVPQGVYFKDDGTKMYVVGSIGDAVYEYSLSIAWELDSTITLLNTVLLGTANTLNLPLTLIGPAGIDFNPSGTKMYISDQSRDVVARFDLSTPWDLSTAVFYDNVYIGFQESLPTGIFYQEDQSKAYVVGTTNDTVYQYNTDVPSLELASAGITTRSSVIINNEARLNNRLYVTDEAHFSRPVTVKESLQINGAVATSSNLTVSGGTITTGNVAATLLGGNTTTNITLASGQTSGTLIVGGASQTGTITIDQSASAHTLNIASGVTTATNQKTVNIGAGGTANTRTLISLGSATAGAISTVTIPSPTNLLIGAATTTGTASQLLQVTGGAYVSGNLGVGNINPTSKLSVVGDGNFTGVVTATSFSGDGSQLTGISASGSVSISTNTTNSNLLIPYATSFGSTTGLGATSLLVYNPSSGNLGIGTTNPTSKLNVLGNAIIKTTSTGDVNLRLQRSSSSGRAQFTLESESGSQIWRVGLTSGGTETFNFFDGTQNAIQLNKSLQIVSIDAPYSLVVGEETLTGTASQRLQVTGGAYVSGNLGIGTTNPTSKLSVVGDGNFTGVVTATTFVGALTGTATTTTNIPNLTGAITSNNTTTSLGSFTSAQLATALTDETGSGANVFATSPTLVTPILGSASATDINVSGVVTATSFSGSGTNLTGIVTSIVAGTNITISGSTGQVTINSTGGGGGGAAPALDILEVMLFA